MEEAAVAFCPGHISGYFRPVIGKSLRETGSTGAGIVISEGVTVLVQRAPVTQVEITRVDHRGSVIERVKGSPPIEYLMDNLGVTALVSTKCHLPISAGFGLSAAALTASALAANQLFTLGMTPSACSWYAHEAEIIHKTGLGDIAACQGGGIDCRKGPGIDAEIIRLPGPYPRLFAAIFGPLPSPGILGSPEAMDKVTSAFPGTCPGSIEELLDLSRVFSEKSGLITPDVRVALDRCDTAGVPASMTMLGNGIFGIGDTSLAVLSGFTSVFSLEVAASGPRLLPVSSW
jgi:pantoate kinase